MAGLRRQVILTVLAVSLVGAAQKGGRKTANAPQVSNSRPATGNANPSQLTQEQKFVLDTVRAAAALPEPDPQDRLRVLSTAAEVVYPIRRSMAKNLWREGVEIESELIRAGLKPAVSMMAGSQVDCATAAAFVENLPPQAVLQAEQSLIGAVTRCPKQTLNTVSRKLDSAMEKTAVAPRALMAVMEAQGARSAWSQKHFKSLFKSLPDPQGSAGEAGNFAAVYSRMAGEVSKEQASQAGVQLLVWLGKMDDTPHRSLAVTIVTTAMRQALGEAAYQQALQADVSASAVAQDAATNPVMERPPPMGSSVLDAMRDSGGDQSDGLRNLPADERARQAAARGFAAGVRGDREQAGRYFDLAFSAADEAWDARARQTNPGAVVEEVGEAAAQVDPVDALERAQKLRDPTAQAIAMLAVARVVGSNGMTAQAHSPR